MNILMEKYLKENIKMEKKMAKGKQNIRMEMFMKVIT